MGKYSKFLKFLFLISLISPCIASSQVVYAVLTKEPCFAVLQPAAKITYKASVESQKVIFSVENLFEKNINSFTEENCSVIDKENWNCRKSFSTNGKVFKRYEGSDGFHYCHFTKKLLGGWELIKTKE